MNLNSKNFLATFWPGSIFLNRAHSATANAFISAWSSCIRSYQAARHTSLSRLPFIQGSLNWKWSSSLLSGILQTSSNSESLPKDSISIPELFGQLTETSPLAILSTTVCLVSSSRSVVIVIMHLFIVFPPLSWGLTRCPLNSEPSLRQMTCQYGDNGKMFKWFFK